MNSQAQSDPNIGSPYPHQYGSQTPPGYPVAPCPINYSLVYTQSCPPVPAQPYTSGYTYPPGYAYPHPPGYTYPHPPGYTYSHPLGYTHPPGYTHPLGYAYPHPPAYSYPLVYSQPYPPGYTPLGYPQPTLNVNNLQQTCYQGNTVNNLDQIIQDKSKIISKNDHIFHEKGILDSKSDIPKYPPGLPIPTATQPIISLKEIEKPDFKVIQPPKQEKTSGKLLLEILTSTPKSQVKSEPNSTNSQSSITPSKGFGFKSSSSNNDLSWVRGHSPSIIQNLKSRCPERRKEQPIDIHSPKTNFELLGNRVSLSQHVRNIVNNIDLFSPKSHTLELNKQDLLDTIKQGDELFASKDWILAANIHRGLLEKLQLVKVSGIDYESEKDWSSHISHNGKLYIGSKSIPRWPVNNLADFMNINPEIYQYIGIDSNYNRLKRYKAFVIDNLPYKDFAMKYFPLDYEKHQKKSQVKDIQDMYENVSENTDDDSGYCFNDEFFNSGDLIFPGEVLMPDSKVKCFNRFHVLEENEESITLAQDQYLINQKKLNFESVINFNSDSKFESKIDTIINKIKSIKSNFQAIGHSFVHPNQKNQLTPSDKNMENMENMENLVYVPDSIFKSASLFKEETDETNSSAFALEFKREFKNSLGIEIEIDPKMFKHMINSGDEDLELFVSNHKEDFSRLYNTFNPTESLFQKLNLEKNPDSNWNNQVKKPISTL